MGYLSIFLAPRARGIIYLFSGFTPPPLGGSSEISGKFGARSAPKFFGGFYNFSQNHPKSHQNVLCSLTKNKCESANTQLQTHHSKHTTPNTKLETRNSKRKTQNSKQGTQHTKLKARNSQHKTQNSKQGTPNSKQ